MKVELLNMTKFLRVNNSMKFIFTFILIQFSTVFSYSQKETLSNQDDKKMKVFIKKLMKNMTVEDKIGQLNLLTPGSGILTGSVVSTDVESKIRKGNVGGLFGIHGPDKIKAAQDLALQSKNKIPLLFGSDVIHGYETTFPIPLGLSSSWDLNLIEKSARVAAIEASANGLNWTFSPMVDIVRDPRWGRVAESGGEDPYLGSMIAKAMVKGYQGENLKSNNTILACVKHFALYGAPEAGREYNTTDMSRLRMYETYLPPYKAAIDAGVGSIMTSFNDIDGIPASGNKWLLTDLLRNQWKFKGFVVSDYTSIDEMTEHGLGDEQTVAALALNSGLDMDMVGEAFTGTLKKSLEEKKVNIKSINAACERILEAKYKLGLFENPFNYIDPTRPAKEILTKENRLLSKEIAKKTFVLLKNDKNVLPVDRNKKIALIGPLANDQLNMLGTWAISGDAMKSISIFEGFKNNNLTFAYTKGCNISDDTIFNKKVNVFGPKIIVDTMSNFELLSNAKKLVASSDVVILAMGEASEMSGECSSRSNPVIPKEQMDFLKEIKKLGKPIAVVLFTGRPLIMNELMELAESVLVVWHPGIEAGNAITEVLIGKESPSGKLTMTFPRNVGQIPIYYSVKNTGRPQYTPFFDKFKSNYIDVDNSPLIPFGFGLSYTSFNYSKIQLSSKELKANNKIIASVEVTNTGNYDGEEIVQLYLQDMVASISRPLKELKAFKKVFIPAGKKAKIDFEITEEELKFWNSDLKWQAEAGKFKIMIGKNSNEFQTDYFEFISTSK
jgi:beta-glucosidase